MIFFITGFNYEIWQWRRATDNLNNVLELKLKNEIYMDNNSKANKQTLLIEVNLSLIDKLPGQLYPYPYNSHLWFLLLC